MFKLTTTAAAQVKHYAEQSGMTKFSLRLAAHQQPNGSIEYVMGFDETKEEDISFKLESINILIAPEYAILLDETVMDFVELEPGVRRFIFLNPKDPTYVPPSE